jgi:RNA polymerase sigma factor (sigma-70 family)
MSEDRSVTDLVARARNGDKRAWDDLVERYAPLVWSICRRHQLSDADAGDVQQSVWLQLVSQLDKIRDPVAPAGWLAATTRRECGRVQRAARGSPAAGHVQEAETIPDQQAGMADQERLTEAVLMAIGDLWRFAGMAGTPARSGPACWLIVAGEPW